MNRIQGIEITVTTATQGYSRMLCFVSGAEVYLVTFNGKTKEKLYSDETDYFVRHFKMRPTAILDVDPVLFPPDTRNIRPKPDNTVNPLQIYSGKEVTTHARVLEKPNPSYTPLALKKEIVGTVVLRAVFTGDGKVSNIHVVKGLPYGLTEAAIAAAQAIRFIPATKDGHPVSMWMELSYNFALK